MTRRRLAVALALVLLLVVLLVGGGAASLYLRAHEPFRGYTSSDRFVEIPAGASPRAIAARLIEAGVVRDDVTFRTALWLSGRARGLQAGEYRFDRPMSAVDVIDKIARGDVYVVLLTFPEGLNLREMAGLYEAGGFGAAATFVEAAQDVSLIKDIDAAATDLEGYLFPDSYRLPRRTDAVTVVRAMVGRFRQVLTPELRAAGEALGLSARQLVTLASIVEKESSLAEERPRVAAVYTNRLKQKIPLQCDPTVIYALQRAGTYDGNLRRDDLAFDSPYNTYRYPGLPPGPIASPGQQSLEAAAHPADVDYLYFVSRNDGSHEFARTLTEHNRNVQKYQIQYFRERRAAERNQEMSR
jgi:UPF0755 protein